MRRAILGLSLKQWSSLSPIVRSCVRAPLIFRCTLFLMASSSICDFENRRIAHARAARGGPRKQKNHGSFRLRGYYVGENPVGYRRLLLSGGALVCDSARSLKVVFIACAPPVRELMKISARSRSKSTASPDMPVMRNRCRRNARRSSSPLPVRERIEGEGPSTARIFCARFKILLLCQVCPHRLRKAFD